jgi:hypothetical protein
MKNETSRIPSKIKKNHFLKWKCSHLVRYFSLNYKKNDSFPELLINVFDSYHNGQSVRGQ